MSTQVKKSNSSQMSTGQKVAIGLGVGVLVAGGIAGGVYFATHHEESTTIIQADSASASGATTLADGKNKITSGGTYTFTGSTANGKITVDTTEEVKIILNNVSITNPEGAAIKCQEASRVTIELVGENTLSSTDKGSSSDDPAAAISSDGELSIAGSGSATITANGKGIKADSNLVLADSNLTITTAGDAVHSNADLRIASGTYNIKTDDDAIHADGLLQIDGGTFTLTAHEGLEATYIKINDGNITINASDDAINAANKSTAYAVKIEINGGNIAINMGQGDTDAIDANGDIEINGGTINITAQSPFDYDGTATLNGGTLIVNGETTTTITNQFMGGGMGGMMGGMMGGNPNTSNGAAADSNASGTNGRAMPEQAQSGTNSRAYRN